MRRFAPPVLLVPLVLGALACGALYEGTVSDNRLEGMKPGDLPAADLILLVEKVHDLNEKELGGSALAVKDGQILAVSNHLGILKYRGAKTVVKEFLGAHLFPGITDAHCHLMGLGASLEELRLQGTTSMTDLVRRVQEKAKGLEPGTWIVGRGWDQNLWNDTRMPVHDALSRALPEHPVWLTRVDGHAGLANGKALAISGLDKTSKASAGGEFLRGPDGELTGVLIDNAMDLVTRNLPGLLDEDVDRRLLAAQKQCFSLGLTRVHDAGISPRIRKHLELLESKGEWKLGVYGMLSWSEETIMREGWRRPASRLRFRAVKIYADGALGSRGAALLEPYSDMPNSRGLMTTSSVELKRRLEILKQKGKQPCIHGIGDRANRIVLDLLEEVYGDLLASVRPRLEHAQVLSPADLPRMAKLGVIASMQPTHLTTDMPWAIRRLGPQRIQGAYAFKTLADLGTKMAFGSDFPVEPANPYEGIFAAVSTISPAQPQSDPLRPDQEMARNSVLQAFTRGAAYAAFEENVRGRIERGYVADLTIVDRDLTSVPDSAIPGTVILGTVVSGEIVHALDD
jgi:predicted amidohydrolase YtcJ